MEIIDLSHNDDLVTIAKKCNINFKNLAWSDKNAVKNQSRIDMSEVDAAITALHDDIDDLSQTMLDYNNLDNKPSIESVTLIGDNTFSDLGLDPLTNSEIEALLNRAG